MNAFKPLMADEVTFSLTIEYDDIPVHGSFASGDDAQDYELECEIQGRLARGDLWAWCCVVVTATWGAWSETDTLGACSYADEADFKRDSYYSDMCDEALARLNETLKADYETLAARATP